MADKENLQAFLYRYLGQPYHGRKGEHRVDLEDVGALVSFNHYIDIAQDIIDYGTAHPEAPFSDILNFIKPGLYGVTEEELLEDD